MLRLRVISLGVFILYLGDVFNKTIIPLAFVGFQMIIANSYPMHARGIIVNYLS